MLALDLEDYPSRLGKNGQLGKFYIGNFEVKLRIIKLEKSNIRSGFEEKSDVL